MFRQKAHINTQKLNWNILMITDIFLNQKRVNVCEHTVRSCPHHVFGYILLIEKDICDCQNISIMLPYVYVCLSPGDLFIFLVWVPLSFPIFCIICISVLFFPRGLWLTRIYLFSYFINSSYIAVSGFLSHTYTFFNSESFFINPQIGCSQFLLIL